MNRTELRELLASPQIMADEWFKTCPYHTDYKSIRTACHELLDALDAAEARIALMIEQVEAGDEECPNCEGQGRMWADGKAHFQNWTGGTIACAHCGGSGNIIKGRDALDAAEKRIAELESKEAALLHAISDIRAIYVDEPFDKEPMNDAQPTP